MSKIFIRAFISGTALYGIATFKIFQSRAEGLAQLSPQAAHTQFTEGTTANQLTATGAQDDINQSLRNNADLRELNTNASLRDFRYATTQNFMHTNVYGNLKNCFLHSLAMPKLLKAEAIASARGPGYKLIIFDCTRPRRVQRIMWKIVAGTPLQKYVGDPNIGSMHNFGFAIDVSLATASGIPLDMGTDFDDFSLRAEPQRESDMLRLGKLTRAQIDNRLILRSVMHDAGFIQLQVEWWHFDALTASKVRGNFPIVE